MVTFHPMYVGGSFGSTHMLGKVVGIAGALAKVTFYHRPLTAAGFVRDSAR